MGTTLRVFVHPRLTRLLEHHRERLHLDADAPLGEPLGLEHDERQHRDGGGLMRERQQNRHLEQQRQNADNQSAVRGLLHRRRSRGKFDIAIGRDGDAVVTGSTVDIVQLELQRGGVASAHLVSGIVPDAVLTEVFTNQGSGSMVVARETKAKENAA